jgi:hypothetical protein
MNVRRDVALHEAGHTTAALMLRGRLPVSVTADFPTDELAGLTTLDFSNDGVSREEGGDFMVITLAGPLAERDAAFPPDWPLEANGARRRRHSTDLEALATLTRFLELDAGGYLHEVVRALELARDEDFNHLVDLIARALLLRDELNTDDLRWLIPDRLLDKYAHGEEEQWNT